MIPKKTNGPDDIRRRHSIRWRAVSTRYPHRVAEAYGGDVARALAETDAQVAATVAQWERSQGLALRDWRAIGAEERDETGGA